MDMIERYYLSIFKHVCNYEERDTWSLYKDIEAWLEDEEIKYDFQFEYMKHTNAKNNNTMAIHFYIDFEDSSDAVKFHLIWGAHEL
jgi:hypothetical protein